MWALDQENIRFGIILNCYCFAVAVVLIILEFDIKWHKILFEDKNSEMQQIQFDGIQFIDSGMQELDCEYGRDWKIKKKNERNLIIKYVWLDYMEQIHNK